MAWPRAIFAAILLSILAAVPAYACTPLPPSPGPQPADLQEALRMTAERATNIVYAVIDRPIRESGHRRSGSIRILHVYKGDMQVGQRVAMIYDYRPVCPEPRRDRSVAIPRGAYGILLLEGAREPFAFPSFVSQDNVDAMIRFGIIRSTRAPGP